MAFVLRTTELPSLSRLTEVSQIVVVDRTGPATPLGVANGAACCVAEFLKGGFFPVEVASGGEIASIYGGFSSLLSQGATGTQDGSAARFEGNGILSLRGKQFTRLILQRVDVDALVTTLTPKAAARIEITVATADKDPLDSTLTGRDIVLPAGTRFADAALGTETVMVALSQDVLIPKGTKIRTTNLIVIAALAVDTGAADDEIFNCVQDQVTGLMTVQKLSTGFPALAVQASVGPTVFFVKGITASAGTAIDTVIDSALPNVQSTITAIAMVNASNATVGIDAPGTGADLQSKIESLYAAAIDKTRPTQAPQEDITIIWSARRGATAAVIRTPLENNAINSSDEGRGRVAIVSGPRVGTATGDAASATAAKTEVQSTTGPESPGRSDRKITTFPYVKVFVDELGRNALVAPDSFMAATLSNFPEEKNPGASNAFIQGIIEMEDAFISTPMSKQDYINFKSKGVSALRRDKSVGWWFQDGVTSVDPAVEPTRAPIKRRRMADFIQDTLAQIGAKYNKQPATTERVDSLIGEIRAFLTTLKSPQNRALQRIDDFEVDETSSNTPALTAQGIFIFDVKVRLIASMDTIVFNTSIGETVEITQTS